jgi:hypothetical protein
MSIIFWLETKYFFDIIEGKGKSYRLFVGLSAAILFLRCYLVKFYLDSATTIYIVVF